LRLEKKLTPKSSRTLGGIGAILMVVGVLPTINLLFIVELIGSVLLLVALRGFASFYKENGIFKNALYGIVAEIVGVAIGIAVILPHLTNLLLEAYPNWNGSWATITSLSGMIPNTSNISSGDLTSLITAGILALAILWVFSITATFFVRRSLKQLSARTDVGLFSKAGLLLLIGGVLVIAIGLGLILMWIGALILTIAFFRIKLQPLPQIQAPVITNATG
jgi:uncharacterized membrane protein